MPKISALPAMVAGDVTTADLLPIVDSGGPTTKKVTIDIFRVDFLAGAGMTATPLDGVTTAQFDNTVGIGVAVATTTGLGMAGAILTTGTTQYGMNLLPTFGSSATTAGRVVSIQIKTEAAAFTMVNAYGLYVVNASIGAASAITNQYGIYIEAPTGAATINRALHIAGGGAVIAGGGLGLSPASGNTLAVGSATVGVNVGMHITSTGVVSSGNVSHGFYVDYTGDSNSTTSITGLYAKVTTAAAAFTATNRYQIYVDTVAKGAGSTITNDYGIYVAAPTQGGTINYGIYVAGGAPAIYVAASGVQIQAGNLGVGGGPSTAVGVIVTGSPVAGVAQTGLSIANGMTFTSAATTVGYGVFVGPTTEAAAFTMTNFYGIYVDARAKGAGSTITNRYGLYIVNPTDGGTLNRALYISGAAAVVESQGRYMAMSGTAVPATAGAVAAGAPVTMYSGALTIEATSDVPTHTRAKGSICINTAGSAGNNRVYVNTDGAGTWTNVTTAA